MCLCANCYYLNLYYLSQHVGISTYFSTGHELSSCQQNSTIFVFIHKIRHQHIGLNFSIEDSLCCTICDYANIFITSAHQQPMVFCIIMNIIPNIKKINFNFFFKKLKYSTCSVHVFFINLHTSAHNKLIQRNEMLSPPNFLQCTLVGQMIIMHINHL